MDDLTLWFFRAVSALAYGFLIWLFVQVVVIIKQTYMPMLTSGKLNFGQIASVVAGLSIFLALLAVLPMVVLQVTMDSFDRFMAVGLERTDRVVNDMQGIFRGEPPVYVREEETTIIATPRSYTAEERQPSGPAFTVPGEQGGGDIGDPNVGGGAGDTSYIPPTAIPQVIYPTPTPFDAGTWNPSMAPPTPQVFPRTVP
jgi:hypothetical protein